MNESENDFSLERCRRFYAFLSLNAVYGLATRPPKIDNNQYRKLHEIAYGKTEESNNVRIS